jgi:flagellar L-ring protein FlgH
MKTLYKSVFSALVCLCAASGLSAESLWLKAGGAASSHYGDRRAARAGDILTVIVSESSTMSASQKTKAEKSAGIQNEVASWLFPASASALGTHNGALPSTDITSENDYEGKGEISNSQSLTARAAVMVVDVLPNGNLVIEGLRSVAFAGEKQYMILRGVVRSDDVTAANTVLSSQIANAYVEIKGEGDISSAQRKGWLMRMNDFLNPF